MLHWDSKLTIKIKMQEKVNQGCSVIFIANFENI